MAQESADNHNSGATTGAALPMGLLPQTRLGEFEIISVIGEGGFSIVYLAHDHQLQRTVAIKEYLPGAIAYRNAEGVVKPRFEKYESTFKTGLQSFLKEARILAQFEHHSLIRIHRFWEQNGTAYMVMQYCQGKTMRQVLQNDPSRGRDEQWLKHVMAPVLDALRVLHSRNCYHRDLSPDNIMILDSGVPMLLDFGAARQVIGDMTQALTVILKPGFAPIEQYADDESMRQGPWTDIYGAGAVLYFAATGKAPTASVARLVKDPLKKLASLPELSLSPEFAGAVDHALSLFPADRPQSVDEFASELMAQEGPVSHFQVFPTLSGAAVTASAIAAQQEAALAHTGTGTGFGGGAGTFIGTQSPTPVNELLRPAHEEWSPPAVAPAPEFAQSVDSIGDVFQHAATPPSTPPSPTQVSEASPDADAYIEPPIPAPAQRAPEPSPQPARAAKSVEKPAVAAQKKPAPPKSRSDQTAAKRGWGLYAVIGGALLVVLVALAYFFGEGHPSPQAAPSVSQSAPESTAPQSQTTADAAPTRAYPSTVESDRTAPQAVDNNPPNRPVDTTSTTVGNPSTVAPQPTLPDPPVITPPPRDTGATTQMSDTRTDTAGSQPTRQAPTPTASNPNVPASQPTVPSGRNGPGVVASTDGTPATAPASGASTARADASKPGAYVRLAVRPWGKVFVDGVERGTSPPMVRIWLPEGDHAIVIENGDFPSFSTRMKVVDKKDASLSHKFGQ